MFYYDKYDIDDYWLLHVIMIITWYIPDKRVQCSRLRYKTWTRLLYLTDGRLGRLLKNSLSSDPVSRPPLLEDGHFTAIDRRLTYVIALVKNCVKLNNGKNILIYDV